MLEKELPHSLSLARRAEITLPILVVFLSLLLWVVFHMCLSPWGHGYVLAGFETPNPGLIC